MHFYVGLRSKHHHSLSFAFTFSPSTNVIEPPRLNGILRSFFRERSVHLFEVERRTFAVVLQGLVLLKAHRIFKKKEHNQGFLLSKKNNSYTLKI